MCRTADMLIFRSFIMLAVWIFHAKITIFLHRVKSKIGLTKLSVELVFCLSHFSCIISQSQLVREPLTPSACICFFNLCCFNFIALARACGASSSRQCKKIAFCSFGHCRSVHNFAQFDIKANKLPLFQAARLISTSFNRTGPLSVHGTIGNACQICCDAISRSIILWIK